MRFSLALPSGAGDGGMTPTSSQYGKVGDGTGVVGLGMQGSGAILQACVMSLSRMAASALKLSTKK